MLHIFVFDVMSRLHLRPGLANLSQQSFLVGDVFGRDLTDLGQSLSSPNLGEDLSARNFCPCLDFCLSQSDAFFIWSSTQTSRFGQDLFFSGTFLFKLSFSS